MINHFVKWTMFKTSCPSEHFMKLALLDASHSAKEYRVNMNCSSCVRLLSEDKLLIVRWSCVGARFHVNFVWIFRVGYIQCVCVCMCVWTAVIWCFPRNIRRYFISHSNSSQKQHIWWDFSLFQTVLRQERFPAVHREPSCRLGVNDLWAFTVYLLLPQLCGIHFK